MGTQIPLARFFPQVASFFLYWTCRDHWWSRLSLGIKSDLWCCKKDRITIDFLIFVLQRRMSRLLAQGLGHLESQHLGSQLPMGGAVLCHISLNQSLVFWFWLRMLHCEFPGVFHIRQNCAAFSAQGVTSVTEKTPLCNTDDAQRKAQWGFDITQRMVSFNLSSKLSSSGG